MRLSLGTTGSFTRLDAELNEAIWSQLCLINAEQEQISERSERLRRLAALPSFKWMKCGSSPIKRCNAATGLYEVTSTSAIVQQPNNTYIPPYTHTHLVFFSLPIPGLM